jgi:hypothetical protein
MRTLPPIAVNLAIDAQTHEAVAFGFSPIGSVLC